MFNSSVLDVAIGLILVYLVLALFVTSAGEAISRMFALRAGNLQEAVKVLLGHADQSRDLGNLWAKAADVSPETPLVGKLPTLLYRNALIRGLARKRRFTIGPVHGPLGKGPSYIDAKTFSAALIDTVLRMGNAGQAEIATLRSTAHFRESLTALEHDNQVAAQALTALSRVVEPAVADANAGIAALRGAIEAWFDETMTRAGGWYKRKMQLILFLVGLTVALVLNVDTLAITRALSTDAPLRAAVATHADTVITELRSLEATATPAAGAATAPAPATLPAVDATRARDQLNELLGLGLPIGWSNGFEQGWQSQFRWSWSWFGHHLDDVVLPKVLGILLTSLALTLGAPFWFDVLGKLVDLKSSGGKVQTPQPAPAAAAGGSPGG